MPSEHWAGGNLRELSKELPELHRALANALRGAFGVMQITLREYAGRHHLSVSVVSRYLSGNRLPSEGFIEQTIELAGTRLTVEDATTLRDLHSPGPQHSPGCPRSAVGEATVAGAGSSGMAGVRSRSASGHRRTPAKGDQAGAAQRRTDLRVGGGPIRSRCRKGGQPRLDQSAEPTRMTILVGALSVLVEGITGTPPLLSNQPRSKQCEWPMMEKPRRSYHWRGQSDASAVRNRVLHSSSAAMRRAVVRTASA